MAGAIAHGELTTRSTTRVRFEVATPEHDAAIRRLLRDSAMEGDIAITLEREPSYFAGTNIAGAEDETIIAFERNEVIGMANCSVRQRYVNGAPRRVGYLGELRLSRSAQGRFDVLRRGFQFYAERHQHHPADVYFTSIAADNERSIRFLERGLPGMPRYEFLTEFVTLLITARRKRGVIDTTHEHDARAIANCLNSHAAKFQFAARWTEEQIRSLDRWWLSLGDFQIISTDDGTACAALWDQRAFKQTVVRSYSAKLQAARPLLNLFAKFNGGIRLPRSDSPLSHAFVSPLAANEPALAVQLIEGACHLAATRGIEVVSVGLTENDPRYVAVRQRFHGREYRTRLYRVRWPQFDEPVSTLNNRLIAPDLALL